MRCMPPTFRDVDPRKLRVSSRLSGADPIKLHRHEAAPDVRFGLLIANLAFLAAGPWDQALWNLEDEQLLAAVQQFLADRAGQQQHVA